jgi:hypothetical protein
MDSDGLWTTAAPADLEGGRLENMGEAELLFAANQRADFARMRSKSSRLQRQRETDSRTA